MLVTNPQQRATLTEVLSHPWMIRSYGGPPDPHLVPREPLSVAELDTAVIREMTGFEFGTTDQIHAQLFQILTSDRYRAAAERWRRTRAGESGSSLGLDANATSTTLSIPSTSTATTVEPATPRSRSKRFSGFDFYRKKFLTSPPPQQPTPTPAPAQDLSIPAPEQPDPTRGFHPLVSIYYLVRERMERERVYGPGHFASSSLSLGEESWAQGASTGSGGESKEATPSKSRYAQPVPRLAAPPAPHYSGTSYDVPVPVTPTSAASGQTGPVPRARAKDGEGVPAPLPSPGAPPAGGMSMPRAATHRRSHSLSQRPRAYDGPSGEPKTAGPAVATFSQAERIREEEEPSSPTPAITSAGEVPGPRAASSLARRFGSLLGGAGSASKRVSSLIEREKELERQREREAEDAKSAKSAEIPSSSAPVPPSASGGIGSHRRAATVTESGGAGVSKRHERRGSLGMARSGSGRGEELVRPKTAGDGWSGAGTTVVKEEKEAEKEKTEGEEKKEEHSETNGTVDVKPVYLKGLFSVATTSTKPANVIKADVKRVLDRMQVQYREIRGGFECIHVPSIDLTSIAAGTEEKRTIQRKGSRLSFGKKGPPVPADKKEGVSDKEEVVGDKEKKEGGEKEKAPASRSSLSFAGAKGQTQNNATDAGRTTPTPTTSNANPTSPGAGKGATPETAEDLFENGTTNELCVRFEISIVKVPLLPLHGIQFRRVGGDGWQYQMLARRVLTELKL
ncbi:Serine/threonine-protein kinase [Ceratobasidium sp. AG-Ba]|nr:Serine/threonine-protein kinase [Ceratobasidium sp. AG-Ba]